MEYMLREYPMFSACGLNCGLCPRYHTDGSSKCPGCAGDGFSAKHPPCGVLTCCQRNNLEYCYLCDEFPCKKYDGADQNDSFITHKNQLSDMQKAKRIGIAAYKAELDHKIKILEDLLEYYDDGRRKSFYCISVNLLDLQDLESIMEQIAHESKSTEIAKEKAAIAVRLLQSVAEKRGISLTLRKKQRKIK